ncbi:uncharacterized protein LOC143292344 [Babylonia areolata]|uniref:uncharacterized protein LOC143292344 n=1 Tax=Babylonia areolata TaxID=304850 RepID=UPI003FD25462
MMYPKPKSAPGRMAQSKLAKNRTNATKEMEAWARKTDDVGTSQCSRMSGQLTDNVTEERMLRAKLWELSKERYKFLAQNAYEQKVFTDRMQRKSSQLLRRASSAAPSTCSQAGGDTGRTRAKQRWNNARQALLHRLDPTRRRGGSKGGARSDPEGWTEDGGESGERREGEGEKKDGARRKGSAKGGNGRNRRTPPATPITPTSRPGSVGGGTGQTLVPLQSAAGDREEGGVGKPPQSPLLPPTGTNPRNVKFDHSSSKPAVRQSPAESRGLSPRRIPPSSPFTSRPPSASAASSAPNSAGSQRSRLAGPSPLLLLQGRSGLMTGRYGMKLESKTADPRYQLLEKSLSPLQKRRSQGDVSSIVRSFDSLHLPPRRRNEAKPKIELKAVEYMEQQGFLF